MGCSLGAVFCVVRELLTGCFSGRPARSTAGEHKIAVAVVEAVIVVVLVVAALVVIESAWLQRGGPTEPAVVVAVTRCRIE